MPVWPSVTLRRVRWFATQYGPSVTSRARTHDAAEVAGGLGR